MTYIKKSFICNGCSDNPCGLVVFSDKFIETPNQCPYNWQRIKWELVKEK